MDGASKAGLETEQIDGVTVVRFCDSQILDEANIDAIGRELFRLVDHAGYRRLLLDFGKVDYIYSPGLGKLVTLHRKVNAAGGTLRLCNVCAGIQEILTRSRLAQVFNIDADQAEALAAF